MSIKWLDLVEGSSPAGKQAVSIEFLCCMSWFIHSKPQLTLARLSLMFTFSAPPGQLLLVIEILTISLRSLTYHAYFQLWPQVWGCHSLCWAQSCWRERAQAPALLRQQPHRHHHPSSGDGCTWLQEGNNILVSCSRRIDQAIFSGWPCNFGHSLFLFSFCFALQLAFIDTAYFPLHLHLPCWGSQDTIPVP